MSHLFAGRRWVLETTFREEECVSRLKSKLRGTWETNWDPDRPLYGTVTSSGFEVQISPMLQRVFNPYFVRGVFTPSAAGTTIRAKYGVVTTYRLFVAGLASFFLFTGWRIVQLSSHALPPGLTLFFGSTLLFGLLIRASRITATASRMSSRRPTSNCVCRQQGLEGTQGDAKGQETGPLVPFPKRCAGRARRSSCYDRAVAA